MTIPLLPPKIPLAHLPTPFYPLLRLSSRLGGPMIWIKRDDLTGFELSGNKVRKLEFLLADAVNQKADIILTCGGIQSNHCRATAFAAARLGLKCHLLLRGDKPIVFDGNTLLASLAGAECTYYHPSDWKNLDDYFAFWVEHYRSLGLRAYSIPTGASNAMGLWGYIAASDELTKDFSNHNVRMDLVCCATGSGGTHTGLALGLSRLAPDIIVRGYAVCDNRRYFEEKGAGDLVAWKNAYQTSTESFDVQLDIEDGYIGQGYGLAGESVFRTIELLAQTEGILLDPVYTGKAFHGLIDQIQSGKLHRCNNVAFIHTGGAFGLYPYKDRIIAGLKPQ